MKRDCAPVMEGGFPYGDIRASSIATRRYSALHSFQSVCFGIGNMGG